MASFRFDHVCAVVHDLEGVARFFTDLGFRSEGPTEVGGTWLDRVIGVDGARVEVIVMREPDGTGRLELVSFVEPAPAEDHAELPANAHGYRHIAYQVDDVDAVVAQAREAGYDTIGDVVAYQDTYRLAFIRGPEGLIVEVAEPLQPSGA
jgi:catechol 2,3-dioxygenase-like lactoylglutathione lyase family enzyme